jgi:hypothetical protein
MSTNDQDPIPLKTAALQFGFTLSTLRAEASRGRLTIYRIGKRLYTSPKDIREMIKQCRVEQRGRDFTLTASDSSGLSETERVLSALARAKESAERLKNISPNTSATSTGPKRQRLQ